MWSLLGCCLFGFFLATGTCLECESCFGVGENCTGVMKTCAAEEDTCIISLKQVYQSFITTTFISKDCGPSSECNIGIREVSFGTQTGVRIDRSCCTGDACKTTAAPVLPPLNTLPHGFRCPACLGLFSTDCDPITVACPRSSTQCVELVGQIALSPMLSMDIAMKGCASDALCYNLKAGLHSFGGASANLSVAKCSPATRFLNILP